MFTKLDVVLVLAVLGIAVFILWKAGIFKVTNAAADLTQSVGGLGQKVVDGAGNILQPIVDLPQNLITIGSSIPDFWQRITNNYPIATPTNTALNINDELDRLFPNKSDSEQLKLWSQVSQAAGWNFDSNGYVIDINGYPVTAEMAENVLLNLRYVNPNWAGF